MSIVIDASLALAWVLPDEKGARGQRLFDRLAGKIMRAPCHWPLEVANALLAAERRGRIDAEFRTLAIRDLTELNIRLDGSTAQAAWTTTLDLAARRRLSVYDAAYLELALRLACALATLDIDLARAAIAEGVEAIGAEPA